MEYLPTWLGQLLVGAAGLCFAAILITGATAACTSIYRRHIKPPTAVTVTASTSMPTAVLAPTNELRDSYSPPSASPPPPSPPTAPKEEIECGACGSLITGKPICSQVTNSQVMLVYRCPGCLAEVGLAG